MKFFGKKKREPGYAGDPNHKAGAGGTDDRGLPKTKPEPAVSEESKQSAGFLKKSVNKIGNILHKKFGSTKTMNDESMSNERFLGEIYKLMVENQEDIKFERQESVEKKRTDDNDEENRHKEIIKALTLRRQPTRAPRRAKKEEKPEEKKKEPGKEPDKTGADKAAKDKTAADKAAKDKAVKDKASADKAKADKAKADKAAADKAKADKAKADKDAADKAKADKAAADKVKADKQRELQEKTKREQLDKEKELAKQEKIKADKASQEAKTQAEKESAKRQQEAAQKRLEEAEKAKQKAAEQAAERAKQKAADEAQKKAAEEAQKKAAEEAKRKAAEEAKRKAAEEEKKRVAEEAKRKAAEEEKKRLAEEERKRLAEEKTRTAEKVAETKPASQPTAQTQPKPAPKPDTATPKPAPGTAKPDVGTATQVITGAVAVTSVLAGRQALATNISEHESGDKGYNAYNRGDYFLAKNDEGKYLQKNNIDLSKMSISDYLKRTNKNLKAGGKLDPSDPNVLFAVGKYQIVPKTMLGLVEALKLDPDKTFLTQTTQDMLFAKGLTKSSRPIVDAYINGKEGVTRDSAILALAQEFASVGVPYDIKAKTMFFNKETKEYTLPHVNLKKGESFWKKDGGFNNAKNLPDAVGAALDADRLYTKVNVKPKNIPSSNSGTQTEQASTTNNTLKGDLNKSNNKNSNDSTTFFTDPFGAPDSAPTVDDGPIHTRKGK